MRSRLVLLLVAIGWAALAHAETGRRAASDFHQVAEIEAVDALAGGRAYSVPLAAEASAALRKGKEVRVYDANGAEVPSLVHTAHARAETVKRPVAIFNDAWVPGLRQTVSVEVEGRGPQPVNEFTFEIADEQYSAKVQVQGSDDAEHWSIVRKDLHLIRHTIPGEKIQYVHNTLRIPTSRFRYYRFLLSQSGRIEPFTIERVAVREVVARGDRLELPVRLEPWQNPRDPDPRHHHWKLDLGRAYLGVNRVRLDIDGRDYARPATLWAWNPELSRPGALLATTVAFQYGNDRHADLEDFATDAEQLVVMIDQGDDAPVRLRGARASRPRQQVRFLGDASRVAPLGLYFTPDQAREPKYDLPRRLREYGIADFTALSHGPLGSNPAYAQPPPPWSERVPYLLTALVLVLVLGLAGYIARTVKAGLPPEAPS
ncbi:MAG: DUF3999 family protein [Myxococcales bacterium]|nr:DUF3999 family protein [Myxococcales bacterium]